MKQSELDSWLRNYCAENRISGMLRVTVRDQIQYQASIGFADFAQNLAYSESSMFTLYSLSKPFCAIGLLKLKDRGLVDLDAHPAQYVPEAAGLDPAVTIRHLLHHTSGIPDFEQNRAFAEAHAPGYAGVIREHLKLLAELPSYFAPGTGAMYANVNFVLCALIIENVSGMPYAAYMEQEVFRPLGMKTAVVDCETRVIPQRVQGYELVNGQLTAVEKSHNWMLGAGDLVGTMDDVYCLNRAIKHRLLLREDTWREVLTPSPLNHMGMGCTVTTWHGKPRITHNGGHIGFRTLHIQLPEEDFDLILLSNSGFGNARNDISEGVYSAFYGADSAQGEAVAMDAGYI